MGEEDAHPLPPALENDVQQKTKTQLCPGSLLPMHEAGCPPWKTLGDQGFQYHMALKGDSRGKMFSRRPVKTLGLLLWAAGQAPSAPTKPPPGFALLLRKRWRSRSPSATARPSPPSLVQKTPNTETLQGWCPQGPGQAGLPPPFPVTDLPRAAPGPGGGRKTSHHHPDTLWGLGGGAAIDSVKFPKEAPLPQCILPAWLVAPVIIILSVLH